MRPLVMVPPCINKFYILDLTPENSFVLCGFARIHRFLVSWRNVQAAQGHLTWDDYLRQRGGQGHRRGARDRQCGKVNALGFCVGGTRMRWPLRRMGHDIG